MTFDPHYAIVTASDSGIGKATAVALAEAGMDVGITWYTDSEGAEATADEVRSYGRKALVKQLDYADLPSCAVTVDLLIDDLGGLDVFVNNAGYRRLDAPYRHLL
jgi:NAD(P)-dependent dehydrogenase (short-subunit alcohol dehydrogenase family)